MKFRATVIGVAAVLLIAAFSLLGCSKQSQQDWERSAQESAETASHEVEKTAEKIQPELERFAQDLERASRKADENIQKKIDETRSSDQTTTPSSGSEQ